MFDITPVTTKHSTACGPAALKMLLAYYGQDVPLETLIEECGVSVNGCSAATLLRVGKAHGIGDDFKAWQEDPADVLVQDRPAIIWWCYSHYIVFAGLNDKGEPVICNPSRGRYAIDAGTFKLLVSGIKEGTCVALCVGKPLNMRRVAADNYAAGEYFESNGETCVALRPITKGETLKTGWNYTATTIIDALNAQREE